jgi:DNA-binding MarR family transcriptional regulator
LGDALQERGSHLGDRRVRTLTLTPAGLSRRERLMERLGEPTESLPGLSADDVRALVRVL